MKKLKTVIFLIITLIFSLYYIYGIFVNFDLWKSLILLILILIFGIFTLWSISRKERNENSNVLIIYLIGTVILCSLLCYVFLNIGFKNDMKYGNLLSFQIGKALGLFFLPFLFNSFYSLCSLIHFSVYKPKERIAAELSNDLPAVSIIMATRNEPFDVCKMTFDSANNLRYPAHKKEIVIVDNSDVDYDRLGKEDEPIDPNKPFKKHHDEYFAWKEYVESFANQNNGTTYKFVHRDGTEGFKPRNLDIAMANVSTEYVLFLDADSTLERDTLLKCMPEFNDPTLAFLSLLIQATNMGSTISSRINGINLNFLRFKNELNAENGFGNFQGHNAIWSKKALDKNGSWLEHYRDEVILTEDIASSVRCYINGFHSKTAWVKSGEWAPNTLEDTESMWKRWHYGALQVMHKYWLTILFHDKISLKEKLDIFSSYFKSVIMLPVFFLICFLLPQSSMALSAIIICTMLFSFIIMVRFTVNQSGLYKKFSFMAILDTYLAFFVLTSYITWGCFKSETKYYLKKQGGWKPTGKGEIFKNKDSVLYIMYKNYGKFIFCTIGLIIFLDAVVYHAYLPHFWLYLIFMFPSALFLFNIILAVFLFEKLNKPYFYTYAYRRKMVEKNNEK